MRGTPEQRFWAKVARAGEDECWEWTDHRNDDGYGKLWVNGKHVSAHRFSYELHQGPIAPGMEVLHSCDNPGCCNPRHLSQGTHDENMAQMAERKRANGWHVGQTVCKRGHSLVGAYVKPNGHRQCRECRALLRHSAAA